MDYSLPLHAFLQKYFSSKRLNGAEKFLILCALLAKGSDTILTQQHVKKTWSKTVFKITYNASQHHRAQSQGWVENMSKGALRVTPHGHDHINEIRTADMPGTPAGSATSLDIFSIGKTHSFDKFLRTMFSSATREVLIADAYVDETIFDNLLDQIPDTVTVKLLYSNIQGSFPARVKRFKGEFPKFVAKQHSLLHDRFLIVDDVGYVIGPSLKDAARKSPATVVRLSQADTVKLQQLFSGFWSQAKS